MTTDKTTLDDCLYNVAVCYRATLAERDATIATLEKAGEVYRESMAERDTTIDNLQAELFRRNETIAKLESERVRLYEQVQAAAATVTALRIGNGALHSTIAERDATIERQRWMMKNATVTEKAHEDCRATAAALESENANLLSGLRDRDRAILRFIDIEAGLMAEIGQLRGSALAEQVECQRRSIVMLSKGLETKGTQITTLMSDLERRSDQIDELTSKLAASNKEYSHLEDSLGERDAELSNATFNAIQREKKIEVLKKTIRQRELEAYSLPLQRQGDSTMSALRTAQREASQMAEAARILRTVRDGLAARVKQLEEVLRSRKLREDELALTQVEVAKLAGLLESAIKERDALRARQLPSQ